MGFAKDVLHGITEGELSKVAQEIINRRNKDEYKILFAIDNIPLNKYSCFYVCKFIRDNLMKENK